MESPQSRSAGRGLEMEGGKDGDGGEEDELQKRNEYRVSGIEI